MLPNFFILGAQKSGTTSLYHYLSQHPEIYMSPNKEPHFFLDESLKPWQYYPGQRIRLWDDRVTSLHEYENLFADANDQKAIGEASVWYLYRSEAASRIKQAIRNAKLIAILRNPVERCFSDYKQGLTIGYETCCDFDEALLRDQHELRQNSGRSFHYVPQGFYYQQLLRYLEAFKIKQIRVLLYEDLIDHPKETLQETFRFLEVDETYVPDLVVKKNESPSAYGQLQARNFLLNVFLKNIGRTIFPATQLPAPETQKVQSHHSQKSHPALKERIQNFFFHSNTRKIMLSELLRKSGLTYSTIFKPEIELKTRRWLIEIYKEDILKLEKLTQKDLSRWLQ